MSATESNCNRVVITGIGLITPCGVGTAASWDAVVGARSGIGPITRFDASAFAVRIAGEVKDWQPLEFASKRKLKELDRFSQFALGAATLAMRDAGITADDPRCPQASCIVGIGIGGIETIERTLAALREKSPDKVSPYAIACIIPNMAAGHLAMTWGLKGACYAVSSACASGAQAIGEAARLVQSGQASFALAGGTDASITPVGIAGFSAMFALSRQNDSPTTASRPFDISRSGFVCAEGAAMIVLERYDQAMARGAHIWAELAGYGCTNDAFHPVHPDPKSSGAIACMHASLNHARLNPSDVDYVNAHATSTPQGDLHEANAIVGVFGHHATSGSLWVSSTKSTTGHMLGAAGAAEAAFAALVCATGKVPPTANVGQLDPECKLDVVPASARDRVVRHAVSNSFGFGGCNVSLVMSRV